jgi:hypothetical protein
MFFFFCYFCVKAKVTEKYLYYFLSLKNILFKERLITLLQTQYRTVAITEKSEIIF